MIAVLILVVGALLFLVRFLAAICGRDGKAPHIVYLAQVAPDGPAGGEDDEDGRILAVQAATLTHRSLVPIHVRHGEQRRTKLWQPFAAARAKKLGRRGCQWFM